MGGFKLMLKHYAQDMVSNTDPVQSSTSDVRLSGKDVQLPSNGLSLPEVIEILDSPFWKCYSIFDKIAEGTDDPRIPPLISDEILAKLSLNRKDLRTLALAENANWQRNRGPRTSDSPKEILRIFHLLKQYPGARFGPGDFDSIGSIDNIESRLKFYSSLSQGRIEELYSIEGIPLTSDTIDLRLSQSHGGIALDLRDNSERRFVGFTPYLSIVRGLLDENTTIIDEIQGARGKKEEQDAFKERYGIGPEKLNFLLYLQLGCVLGNQRISIATQQRGFQGNYHSPLYNLPTFTLRIRPDEDGRCYTSTQDVVQPKIDAFRKRIPIVDRLFEVVGGYVKDCGVNTLKMGV